MKATLSLVIALCLFAGLCAQTALAQEPASGYRAEFLREAAAIETEYVRLAQAVPQDKYMWRPAPGVRSISEVYLHIAAANYNLPRMLGVQPPAGFNPKGWETSTTERDKIVAALKESFAHLRQAALSLSDADADKTLKWMGGRENTYRGVLLFTTRHLGEHLGQSIAYARVNGVVPPWTEERMQQQQQKK